MEQGLSLCKKSESNSIILSERRDCLDFITCAGTEYDSSRLSAAGMCG